MALPDVAAVARYTGGRLDAGDQETARQLNAAIRAMRTYCGWHVAPLTTGDVLTLSGRGGPVLRLPTGHLVTVTELVEDGVTVDLAAVDIDFPTATLSKDATAPWGTLSATIWTARRGGIVVTIDHGFDDAEDINDVILSAISRNSQRGAGGVPTGVGPFSYASEGPAGGYFDPYERSILDLYKLRVCV